MSVEVPDRLSSLATAGNDYRVRMHAMLFGDTVGLTLFLASLCFFGFTLRVGTFITDGNAIANTLVNVAEGRLHLAEAPFGNGLGAPGTYMSDGTPYGRNYGIVVAALPFLWVLDGLAAAVDLRIALVGLWSLLVLATFVAAATVLDRSSVAVAGSVLAVLAFLGNVAVAEPIEAGVTILLALQFVTMLATALAVVVCYRLVADLYTKRLGLFAGGALAFGTPIAFWASYIKRHSFTVLFALVLLYALYRGRATSEPGRSLRFRALAYVSVGLMAWIHAAEALLLFLPLVIVDVTTAERNDPRTIATVGGAFLVSLLPFFLTNLAISGNPIKPPRLLPPYVPPALQADGGAAAGGALGGGSDFQIPVLGSAVGPLVSFGSMLVDGAILTVTDPGRMYHTFVRSGFIDGVAQDEQWQAVSLTVLESAPLVAGLVGVPVTVTRWFRDRDPGQLDAYVRSPVGVVDTVAVGIALLTLFLYLNRLPTNAQVTVRYLHPLYAIAVYGLIRLPAARRVCTRHSTLAVGAYAGTVSIGGQLVVLYLAFLTPGLGEAVQFHALLALAAAALLGAWVLSDALLAATPDRLGAVSLGIATGTVTVFVVLSGIDYFDYAGDYLLPAVGRLADILVLV